MKPIKNFYECVTRKRVKNKLVKYSEAEDYISALEFFTELFPDTNFYKFGKEVILELLDFLADLHLECENPSRARRDIPFKEYLADIRVYLQEKLHEYEELKHKSLTDLTTHNRNVRLGKEIPYPLEKERKQGVSSEQLEAILKQLDLNSTYEDYHYGYKAQRASMYKFIIEYINKTI